MNSKPVVITSPGFIQNDNAFSTSTRSLPLALEAQGYDVLPLSAKMPRVWQHRFGDYVDAAADFIQSLAEDRPSISFLGHSMGGLIGLALPEEAARQLNSIVVVGTPLFPGLSLSLPGRKGAQSSTAKDLRPVQQAIRATSNLLARLHVPFPGRTLGVGFRLTQRLLDRRSLRYPLQVWAPGALSREELQTLLSSSFSTDSFGALADLLELSLTDGEAAGRIPMGERLRNLGAPLLCIGGDLDGIAPLAACHEVFQRAGSSDKIWLEASEATVGHQFGHVDLLTSAAAEHLIWPPIVEFLEDHRGV